MNIAFHAMGNEQWMAGRTVLEAFLHALKEAPPGAVKRSLTVWDNQPPQSIPYGPDVIDEIIDLPSQPAANFDLTDFLRQFGVDVFFSLPIQTALNIHLPRIVWIYDFQHMHHPELLAAPEVERRNRLFRENAQTAGRIVVTAQTVLDDLAAFAPDCAGRGVLLPIVPWIPREAFQAGRPAADGLPSRYFFLPNHFLRHKNHRTVLQALRLLRQRGVEAKVVCTGNRDDSQGGACYEELMRQCREWELESDFLVLGLVPRDRFYELLRHGVAVINPSLFEGFGLSVAEARFMGAPALLSDLPVLREHGHPNAHYFPPSDFEALAALMETAWRQEAPAPVGALLLKTYQQAQADFARRIFEVAGEALNG